jgi:pimeloyl-ACP methyl ester carboxylesterase
MLLHYEDTGSGSPVLLLHGTAASLRYWDSVVSELTGHRVIALDLLGFGHSPKPRNVTYNVDTHLQSILDTLTELKISKPIILVGHSMGGLLALKFALKYPEKVKKLVLIAMPIYKTPTEARQSITGGRLSRRLAYYGPTSHALCITWCTLLRPLSSHAAKLYLKNQPAYVTRESVLHTWQSYSQSMRHIIEDQQVEYDLNRLAVPTLLLYGHKEGAITLQNVASFHQLSSNITIETIDGSHNLPIERPDLIAQKITT